MHALNDTTAHSATAALRVEFRHEPLHALLADPRLLAVFGFGDAVPAAHDDPRYLHVALPAHGDAPFECWRVEGEIAHGRKRGIASSSNGALQFGALEIADAGSSADIETAAAEAYARLHDWLAHSDYPHPLRIWNYLDAITAGEGDDERDDLTTGALSIMWDLDERASILGEVQLRDDPVDEQDDYAVRGHGGLAYRINKRFSLMGYVGSSSGMYEDVYGMGRLVCQF